MNDKVVDDSSLQASAWIQLVAAECQRFVGQIECADDPSPPLDRALAFLARLPDPTICTEDHFLRATLIEFSTRWAVRAHTKAHQGDAANCDFRTDTGIEAWWCCGTQAKHAFRVWAQVFFTALERVHQAPAWVRAAEYIALNARQQLSVRRLGREVGMHPVALRREFQRSFGISLREYHVHARVHAAMPLIADSAYTMRMVADALGYASPKNFYRALRQVTKRRPSELRNLSVAEAAALARLPSPKPAT